MGSRPLSQYHFENHSLTSWLSLHKSRSKLAALSCRCATTTRSSRRRMRCSTSRWISTVARWMKSSCVVRSCTVCRRDWFPKKLVSSNFLVPALLLLAWSPLLICPNRKINNFFLEQRRQPRASQCGLMPGNQCWENLETPSPLQPNWKQERVCYV